MVDLEYIFLSYFLRHNLSLPEYITSLNMLSNLPGLCIAEGKLFKHLNYAPPFWFAMAIVFIANLTSYPYPIESFSIVKFKLCTLLERAVMDRPRFCANI